VYACHEAGGLRGEGSEYEIIGMCDAECRVGDVEVLVKFNAACDEWGLDTIPAVLALAMDLTERGIEDFGVRFGQADAYVTASEVTATRSGVGDELALPWHEAAHRH
jgi:aldehyde:ferredoxin oxidoreductase